MPLFDEAGHPIHTQNHMRHNTVTPITDWSPFAALNNPLLMLFYIVVVVYVILCSVAAYFVTRKQVERRRNKPLFCLAYVGFTVFFIIFGVPLVVFGIIYSVIKTVVDKRRELLREKIAHQERKIRHELMHREYPRNQQGKRNALLTGGGDDNLDSPDMWIPSYNYPSDTTSYSPLDVNYMVPAYDWRPYHHRAVRNGLDLGTRNHEEGVTAAATATATAANGNDSGICVAPTPNPPLEEPSHLELPPPAYVMHPDPSYGFGHV